MSEENEDISVCDIVDSNARQTTDKLWSITWNGQITSKDGQNQKYSKEKRFLRLPRYILRIEQIKQVGLDTRMKWNEIKSWIFFVFFRWYSNKRKKWNMYELITWEVYAR